MAKPQDKAIWKWPLDVRGHLIVELDLPITPEDGADVKEILALVVRRIDRELANYAKLEKKDGKEETVQDSGSQETVARSRADGPASGEGLPKLRIDALG